MNLFHFDTLCITLSLVSLLLLSSCTHPTEVAQTSLFDVTDEPIMRRFRLAETCATLSGIEKNIYNGVTTRYSFISDVRYNESVEYSLPKADKLGTIKARRLQEITAFKNRLDSLEQTMYGSPPGRPKSRIFATIVNELVRLKNSEADERILLIYNCNLYENTTELSLYERATIELLLHDPAAFTELLQSTSRTKLPESLTDIDVHFIYQTNDPAEDNVYDALVGVYKKLLEERGATVLIGTTF